MNKEAIQSELGQLRPQLVRFARLQLRSDPLAEDVVQETLLAAFEGVEKFAGASSIKTWVFSILRNKIIDEFRSQKRSPQTQSMDQDDGVDQLSDALFDQRDHWASAQSEWGDPAAALEQTRFWRVFEVCLDGLQEAPARVFMMREFLGLDTQEICKELAISASNCWVLLHRARLALRECLGQRWFGEREK